MSYVQSMADKIVHQAGELSTLRTLFMTSYAMILFNHIDTDIIDHEKLG